MNRVTEYLNHIRSAALYVTSQSVFIGELPISVTNSYPFENVKCIEDIMFTVHRNVIQAHGMTCKEVINT